MSSMLIPELVRRKAEQLLADYAEQRIDHLNCPHVILEQFWYESGVDLSCRDGCNPPWPVARFQYLPELHQWFLFAPAEKGQWRPCLDIRPSLDLVRLLQHLNADPFNLFWPPSFTCFS